MAQDDRSALLHRRPRQPLARLEIMGELAEDPGIALCGTADHDAVAARDRADLVEVVERAHVTVGDDRDLDRALDGADDLPVRTARVELLARAAVHGDGIHAGFLRQLRHLNDIDRRLVPALAHLDRHGHLDRLADGRENGERALWVTHQGRALPILDDLRRGAAHVEVEDVRRAECFDKGGRFCRHLRCIGEDLHGQRPLLFLRLQHSQRALVAEVDAL